MTRMSLYDVTKEGLELEEILTAMDGELTPEVEQRFDAFLKSGKESINAAACVVRSLEASAEAAEIESGRLAERCNSFLREAESLKARILTAVDAAFDGKVKTPLFTVWGQTSAPTVGFEVAPDADLAEMQKAYPQIVRTKYELDKVQLKSLRATGQPVPQAVTVVERPGTRYLRIK